MKKLSVCSILFVLCLLPFALQAQKDKIVETRTFPAFSKVKMEGNVDLLLYPSDENKIRIESNKKIDWDQLITEVRGEELHVYLLNPPKNSPKLKIKLAFTKLEALTLEGKIRLLTQSPIIEENLKIEVEGLVKGQLDVETQDLSVKVEGLSRLAVAGKSEYLTLRLEGMGRIDASRLVTQYADTKVEGMGKTKVDVRKAYTASHEGIGSIHYSGNPKKKKINREGISIVRKR